MELKGVTGEYFITDSGEYYQTDGDSDEEDNYEITADV